MKQVSPRRSSTSPEPRPAIAEELFRANVVATRNLFEAVAKLDPAPAVIVAGSAAEYGDPIADRVAEDHPTRPVTEYGRAKVQQSTVVQQIAGAAGLRFSIIRPFNIVSSELPATVALGNIRRQLLAASGPLRTVRCGRLDVVRDFIPLELVVDTVVRLLELEEWPPILECVLRGWHRARRSARGDRLRPRC